LKSLDRFLASLHFDWKRCSDYHVDLMFPNWKLWLVQVSTSVPKLLTAEHELKDKNGTQRNACGTDADAVAWAVGRSTRLFDVMLRKRLQSRWNKSRRRYDADPQKKADAQYLSLEATATRSLNDVAVPLTGWSSWSTRLRSWCWRDSDR
jgi:hypothetical protein